MVAISTELEAALEAALTDSATDWRAVAQIVANGLIQERARSTVLGAERAAFLQALERAQAGQAAADHARALAVLSNPALVKMILRAGGGPSFLGSVPAISEAISALARAHPGNTKAMGFRVPPRRAGRKKMIDDMAFFSAVMLLRQHCRTDIAAIQSWQRAAQPGVAAFRLREGLPALKKRFSELRASYGMRVRNRRIP